MAYLFSAWLPEDDPVIEPNIDEHGMVVTDPDDPDDVPQQAPARGATEPETPP